MSPNVIQTVASSPSDAILFPPPRFQKCSGRTFCLLLWLVVVGEEKQYETSHDVFRGILVKQMMAITMKDGDDGVMRLLMIACFVNIPLI